MGLIWFWGGEHGTVNEFDFMSGAGIKTSVPTGMSGSYCLDCYNTPYYNGIVYKNIPASATVYVGMRYWYSPTYSSHRIISFANSSNFIITATVSYDTYLVHLYRGNGTTIIDTYLDSSESLLTPNVVNHLEHYIYVDNSLGRYVLKINGIEAINFTGDTLPGTDSTINRIILAEGGSISTRAFSYYDDIVIRDDTWPGDVRVGGKEVSGDSSPQQWLLSAGTTPYLLINDTDDTDYIYTNSNMRQELFQLADTTEPIYAVQGLKVVARSRLEGSPHPTHLKVITATAGITSLTSGVTISSSFANYPFILSTNPATSAAWTQGELDSLQFGVQSLDPTLVARWRFESGNLLANSISSYNYLTPVGGTLYADTGFVKEGSSSVKYWYSYDNVDMGYYILEDSNASSDFPLRAGDTQKLITMCGWFHPITVSSHYPLLFGKDQYYSGGQGISTYISNGTLRVVWAYASTPGLTVNQDLTTSLSVSVDRWYHVGVTANGVDKTCQVRFWDDYNSTASTVNLTFNYVMVIDNGSHPFRIGSWIDWSYYGYRGYLDDIRVYNRRLSVDEIDLIRQGVN